MKNFNGLLEKQADFEAKGDYASLISIQQAIKFNGGGHVSHRFLSADPHHHHHHHTRNLSLFLCTRARPSLAWTDRRSLMSQVNHSIFWNNMCPKSDYAPPSGALGAKIDETFGSLEALQTKMSAMSAGVQGSGWGWLAYDPAKDSIFVTTTSNQDPLVTQGNYVPLLGVDVWEHACEFFSSFGPRSCASH